MLSAHCGNRFSLILTSSVVLFSTEFLLALWPAAKNMLAMKFQKVFSLKTNPNIKLGGVDVLLF